MPRHLFAGRWQTSSGILHFYVCGANLQLITVHLRAILVEPKTRNATFDMPAVQLTRDFEPSSLLPISPLPHLLQTPAGLAIIEIQGTIHVPNEHSTEVDNGAVGTPQNTVVGRLEFPLYVGDNADGPWMKRAHLYIGKNQRLSGEVKRLTKPLVVLSRDRSQQNNTAEVPLGNEAQEGQLSIEAIVKYKMLFSSRPEPVGK